MAVQEPSSAAVERASSGRAAPLFAAYSAYGAYWGVWAVVFADYLRANRLSEGAAGLQFGALAITSILTMTLVSPRLQGLPLSVTIPLGLVFLGTGAMMIGSTSRPVLYPAFVVLGVGNGLLDVFVNVGGQAVEARRGRPVLQFLHASYNLGGIVGAVGAGALHAAGAPYRSTLALSAVAYGSAAVWAGLSPWLRRQPKPEATEAKVSVGVFRRSPLLLLPAIVVMSAFAVEGSMDVWSVIFLRRTLGATALTGGLAFAAYSAAMAFGRMTAGRLLFGIGYRATLRVAGFGSLTAGLAASLTTSTLVAAIAFLFLGFFIASAAPAAFGMVSESDEDPALAIAAMTTVGYSGFVVFPPIMGWLAGTAGLRATMVLLVLLSLGVVVGGAVGRGERTRAEPEARPSG